MKTVLITLSLLLLSIYPSFGQETAVPYRKEKMNVMGQSYSGYSVPVPYSDIKTKEYLITYLKENGKISEKKNFIEIKETYWKSKDEPFQVYAQIIGISPNEARIWIGYTANTEDSFITALESQMESLPFIMHKQHLQAQIKEAETAASFLSKELKQAEREGERLNRKLEQNAREKVRLEEALVKNSEDKAGLEEEVVGNTKNQEEKAKALDEVKKQLEYLQEKLRRL